MKIVENDDVKHLTGTWVDVRMRPVLKDTTRFKIVEECREIQHRLDKKDESRFEKVLLTETSKSGSDDPGAELILRLEFSVADRAQNLHGEISIRDMKGKPLEKCEFKVIDDNAQNQSQRDLEAQRVDFELQIVEKKKIDEEFGLKLQEFETEYGRLRQACVAGHHDLEQTLAKK
jgi:hypothetical protein